MKILFTSFSAKHAGMNKRPVKTASMNGLPELFKIGAELLGHEVTIRLPRPGDNPKDWDLYVVLYQHAGLLGSCYFPNALTFEAMCEDAGVPTLAMIDDAALKPTYKQLKPFGRKERFISRSQMRGLDMPWIIDHADRTVELIRDRTAKDWPAIISCMFPWGDRQMLQDELELPITYLVDPSAMLPTYVEGVDWDAKKEQWVFAGCRNYGDWLDQQGVTWPVLKYGTKGIDPNDPPQYIPEGDLVRKYAESWGFFSPTQDHTAKGSGWWRSRPWWAIQSGALWIGDKGEGEKIGDAWTLTAKQVEEMPPYMRKLWALEQRKQFLEKAWSADYYLQVLDGLLKDLATGAVSRASHSPYNGPATVFNQF